MLWEIGGISYCYHAIEVVDEEIFEVFCMTLLLSYPHFGHSIKMYENNTSLPPNMCSTAKKSDVIRKI